MSVINRFSFGHWGLRSRVSALVALPLIFITLLTVYNINTAINRETESLQNRGEKLSLLAANTAPLALFAGDTASLNTLSSAIMNDSQIANVLFFDDEQQLLTQVTTTCSKYTP